MPPSPTSTVAIAWYLPGDYPRLTALMSDGASFPKTHASWQLKAVRMERELKRQGLTPVRVEVDPQRFERWCAQQAVALDSAARNRFVEEALARQAIGSV
jgi:hypothetical protein